MLLDLSIESIDSVVALIVATSPPAVFIQAQDPTDSAFRRALKKIGAAKIGAKFVMSPKEQYTMGDNGWPIGRASFPRATVSAIEEVTDNGDLVVTPRFTEFGSSQPQLGVGIHAFYMTTGKTAVLCTGAPNAEQQVRPLCLNTASPVARALVSLHALDFDFNAIPVVQQQRIASAREALVFSPENNSPLLALLRQPQLLVSTAHDLDAVTAALLMPNASSLTLLVSNKVSTGTSVMDQLRRAGAKIATRSIDHGGTVVVGLQETYFGSHRLQALQLQKSRDVGVILPTAMYPNLRRLAM